jgi:hypothetical protein
MSQQSALWTFDIESNQDQTKILQTKVKKAINTCDKRLVIAALKESYNI